MDKPSQAKPYAGLVIYRIQRNVEFLLLNDSFANKKNWFCPKGQVIGNEDEIKCALRETLEATGLRPKELHVEEGFAIELKYLSGTKPKKVKYHLAQLVDSHVRLLPNAEGVHMQWFSQSTCCEKVVFKTMQEVFKHAQSFIDLKRRKLAGRGSGAANSQQDRSEVKSLSISGDEGNKSVYRPRHQQTPHPLQPQPQQLAEAHKEHHHQPQQQQQQQIPSPSPSQQTQQQNSPLYKTRLCERFETEGSCPYGPKCNFAHGVVELRGRTTGDASNQQQHQQDKSDDRINVDSNGNQLFKTKLCEKFMKDKFCQYGPKCHFAHGEEELKTRPPKREETAPVTDRRSSPPHHRFQRPMTNDSAAGYMAVDTHHEEMSAADKCSNWRLNANDRNKYSSETLKKAEPLIESTSQKLSELPVNSEPQQATTAKPNGPSPVALGKKEDQPKPTTTPVPAVSVEELRRPAFVEHQRSTNNSKKTASLSTVNGNCNGKEKKHTVTMESNEKSWMKIVKLSKEEQDEMEHQSSKSPSISTTTTKLTQKEPIIVELKKFFSSHPPQATIVKGKLTEDVKEVTKVEMRNDLSKKQLLYILLVSLLEEESDQSMLAILKSRNHLFKTFVKTKADQLLLLKAWDSFVTVRKPIMVNKTAIALSHWYDCEMVEEEAFLEWFETLEKGSALEKKSSKFIDWLNESDSEDE
ncbi:Glycerol-3-phosphate/dihydroxyacetone phosphate acyltransferase [Mucor velutinosus]|uniref:Bis(5'-nucleosyl)-tetraphosphatase [asymmetrical] n=1 Tax=Mucor velutinosus TaxID=708070 RepID=A0AAN7DJD7_9FUNG|nr:Glycerol-3-phosphate/dihydroxyacetone phosphate acyltransferase [Mucor velutinosus]